MEFDINRVYTAVNADELKVGSKVICANTIGMLKTLVESDTQIDILKKVEAIECQYRFVTENDVEYTLAYLVSEPEEKKLKVLDLKLFDVVKHKACDSEFIVTGIDYNNNTVFFGDGWFNARDLENWEKVNGNN